MIHISTQQIQKQTLSPIMQQSINILMLHIADLNIAIEQELESNPLLEKDEKKSEELKELHEETLDRLYNLKNLNTNLNQTTDDEDYNYDYSQSFSKYMELEENLCLQLKFELTDPLEIKIGEFIIGNLDEDGYLKTDISEIAKKTGADKHEDVERVLSIVQSFEPEGIAARDLKECLLLQIKSKNMNGMTTIVQDIIYGFIPELGKKKYLEIARKLKVPINAIHEAAKIISSLDPRPARNFRPIKENIYIHPDITISKDPISKEYEIYITKNKIPYLKINKQYKDMLKISSLKQKDKSFIQENLKRAIVFIQSIDQRNKTLYKISEYILEKQKMFFEEGIPALVTMTLDDVANKLNRNKSTISRAINNKFIDTPKGMFPIKLFFSQGINKAINGTISSKSIKEEIKSLTAEENKSKPLSDKDIQVYFSRRGMEISRRTVSKYRQSLKILPSHLRKNLL